MQRSYRFVVLVVAGLISIAVIVSGCVASRVDADLPPTDQTFELSIVESRIRTEFERWEGTPHVIGGTTSTGIDCSAFVQRVFADAFDLYLPRTTEEQVYEGGSVSSRELRSGDLVFFRLPKTRHVGIYLRDGEFAHASSSQGVTISKLDLPYWQDAYWTSRRVLPEWTAKADGAVGNSGAPKLPDRSSLEAGHPRVGW